MQTDRPRTSPPAPPNLVVEGGGSRTDCAVVGEGGMLRPQQAGSCNPRSVGAQTAVDRMVDLISRAVAEQRGEELNAACLALSTVSTHSEMRKFEATVRQLRLRIPQLRNTVIWVTNDIVPLVLPDDAAEDGAVQDGAVRDGAAETDCRVAAICGTGTGFAARGSAGWWRCSGYEYVLSDEGGGHDIGQRALRAVVRAVDGRGAKTRLSELVGVGSRADVERVYDQLHDATERKPLVAGYARAVVRAAGEGDGVAMEIMRAAAVEVAQGIVAAARGAGGSGRICLRLGGSLLTEPHSPMAGIVLELVEQAFGVPATVGPVATQPLWPAWRLLGDLESGVVDTAHVERHFPLRRFG